jgi:hypothetical protein
VKGGVGGFKGYFKGYLQATFKSYIRHKIYNIRHKTKGFYVRVYSLKINVFVRFT